MHDEICPVCGEGQLEQQTEERTLEHNGISEDVPGFVFSACNTCGAEIANDQESKINKRFVLAFRKRADGMLSGSEIRYSRKTILQLNQKGAAKIFGGGQVAFSKYENDDITQNRSMDMLLRVASAVPAAFEWLTNYAADSFPTFEKGTAIYRSIWGHQETPLQIGSTQKPTAAQYKKLDVVEIEKPAANLDSFNYAEESA